MNVGLRRRHAPAGGALDEALLEQIRLVDVLEGVLLLGDDYCKGAETDRAAVELLDDGAEDRAVEAVEALVVYLQQLEGLRGRDRIDRSGVADLGEVPHAPEQAVGHTRGAAAAAGDRLGASVVDLRTQD